MIVKKPLMNEHAFFNPDEYQRQSKLQYDFAHHIIAMSKIKPTDKVLDIGCGDGKITADIASIVSSSQVIGTDISAQMVHFATQKHVPRHKNLSFIVMRAERNIFINQFDVVVSFCCLHWVKRQGEALLGIKSSLAKGGKAILLVPLRHEELYTSIEYIISSEKWRVYFEEFTNPHVFFTKDQYNKLLINAGLVPQSLHEEVMTYYFIMKLEMEMFLKAWLPHIKRIPENLKKSFLSDIGNKFIEIVPQKDGIISMPLRMLKVHACKKI